MESHASDGHPILFETDDLSSSQRANCVAEGLIYESGNRSRWRAFVDDLLLLRAGLGLLLWRSWLETKARYRRSVLGPLWLTFGTLTFIVGYSVLAGLLFNKPLEEFLGYIACGVVAWQLITTNVTEGSKVFVTNSSEIKSFRSAFLSYPLKLLLRSLIGFLHNLPVVLFVVYFTDDINLNTLQLIPGLILLCAGFVPLTAMLGTLSARFRDIEQLSGMLMQFFFYMTPLLWKAELLGGGRAQWIVIGNPFYYAVTIIRNPMLGEPVPHNIWIGAVVMVIIANLLGYLVFARFRQRLPFWI